MLNKKTAIIIPVYNEGQVIESVASDVLNEYQTVICVDDGSSDNSITEIQKTGALLVKHPINMGQGAALQTGMEYALHHTEAEFFVTFDADGQHRLQDVGVMVEELEKDEADIVLGSRFLGEAENIPKAKKILLKAAIRFTNLFSGVELTDAHNGLRAFNRKFAEQLEITMPDMAHASEIIERISNGKWRYKEVPITIKYTEYSVAKGQSMFNAVNILFDIMLARMFKK